MSIYTIQWIKVLHLRPSQGLIVKCFPGKLLLGRARKGLVMESSGTQAFLVYIQQEYAAGAVLAPPPFLRPDVILGGVFYE